MADEIKDQRPRSALICAGCNSSINGDSVVSFGRRIYHIDCFSCSRCGVPVEYDANLLMLKDESPICEKCYRTCRVCGLMINEKAIVIGKY